MRAGGLDQTSERASSGEAGECLPRVHAVVGERSLCVVSYGEQDCDCEFFDANDQKF